MAKEFTVTEMTRPLRKKLTYLYQFFVKVTDCGISNELSKCRYEANAKFKE